MQIVRIKGVVIYDISLQSYILFYDISGATISMTKTEILQIGNHNHNNIPETHRKYIKTQIKTLGLIIAKSDIYKLNYDNTINKIVK